MFSIDTENFTGPLDVLLTLIQKNKLNICEISLSKIADEFLELVSNMSVQDVDMISDFIYISSKLIDMKSKYMLYIKSEDEDEDELVICLEEYAKYKSLSYLIKDMYLQEYMYFEKKTDEIFVKEELDLSKLNIDNITKILYGDKKDDEQLEIRFTKRQKSLTKKIGYIENIVEKKNECFFDDIVIDDEKDEKVVSILGVLHLVREDKINVSQQNNFDRIKINKKPTLSQK